jgi:hypothetical protein
MFILRYSATNTVYVYTYNTNFHPIKYNNDDKLCIALNMQKVKMHSYIALYSKTTSENLMEYNNNYMYSLIFPTVTEITW